MSDSIKKISIFLIADNQAMLDRLPALCKQYPQLAVIGCSDSIQTNQKALRADRPDVIVMAITNSVHALAAIGESRESCPNVRVLGYVGNVTPADAMKLIAAGLSGLCSPATSMQNFLLAVQSVAVGALWFGADVSRAIGDALGNAELAIHEPAKRECPVFSTRQYDILNLLSKGYTNQQMANSLDLSVETIKSHLRGIMDKTGMRSRQQLIAHLRLRTLRPPDRDET